MPNLLTSHNGSTEDWCSKTRSHVHSFYDMSYWNGEMHPTCEACGFIDYSRELENAKRSEKD